MNVKRILNRLNLGKIAAVDRPCQEGAVVALIKRDPGTNGAKLAKSIYDALEKAGLPLDAACDPDESAQAFDDVLGEQQLRDSFWGTWYKGTSALQESVLSILKDDDVTDKPAEIQNSLKQFADYIEQILPGDIGKSLAAGIAASVGQPGTTTGEVMTPELKKALGLSETASEADVLKAVADNTDKVTKLEADLEKAKTPPPAADDGDADDMTKALASGDAFKTPEGTVITKKALGNDAAFTLAKSQNDRLVKAEGDLAKAQEVELDRTFAKRADELGLGTDFGPTLRKAYGGDATAQGELEKRIEGLKKQVDEGHLFKNFGHSAPAADSATAELLAKVDELRKATPSLSYEQAYTKVYTDRANAPIVKRMKTEAAAA